MRCLKTQVQIDTFDLLLLQQCIACMFLLFSCGETHQNHKRLNSGIVIALHDEKVVRFQNQNPKTDQIDYERRLFICNNGLNEAE